MPKATPPARRQQRGSACSGMLCRTRALRYGVVWGWIQY